MKTGKCNRGWLRGLRWLGRARRCSGVLHQRPRTCASCSLEVLQPCNGRRHSFTVPILLRGYQQMPEISMLLVTRISMASSSSTVSSSSAILRFPRARYERDHRRGASCCGAYCSLWCGQVGPDVTTGACSRGTGGSYKGPPFRDEGPLRAVVQLWMADDGPDRVNIELTAI